MAISDFFNWGSGNVSDELPDIFPMPVAQSSFVKTDVIAIYAKILTDVLERTQGVPEEFIPLLWDNCLASEADEGLITLIAKAMEAKANLFIVFKEGVVRRANNEESELIRADYAKTGKSPLGVYISFLKYDRTDMIKLYSGLEYCAVASLNKSMNVSKAMQYKISDLRASVSLSDSAQAKAQAKNVATALSKGKDVYFDSKDSIETLKPDLDATEKSIAFIDAKRCFYLGLPLSYITGVSPKGLGDSGEGDSKAIERGLKNYYFSIMKPALESIFQVKTNFKSQDFRQVATALEALKTFQLTDEEFISKENKLLIINSLLGVDSELGEVAAPIEVPVIDPQNDARPNE